MAGRTRSETRLDIPDTQRHYLHDVGRILTMRPFCVMPMNNNLSKEDLLARTRTLESKLEVLESSRNSAIDDQRSRALRDISSGISHNLNNLLTGMLL